MLKSGRVVFSQMEEVQFGVPAAAGGRGTGRDGSMRNGSF